MIVANRQDTIADYVFHFARRSPEIQAIFNHLVLARIWGGGNIVSQEAQQTFESEAVAPTAQDVEVAMASDL